MGFDLEMFLTSLLDQGFIKDKRDIDLMLDSQDFRLLIPVLVSMHKVLKHEMGLNDVHKHTINSRVRDVLVSKELQGYVDSRGIQ